MALRGKDGPSSCAPLGEAGHCAVLPAVEGSQLGRRRVPLPLPALPQFTSDCSRGVFWREREGGEGEATSPGLLKQPAFLPAAPRPQPHTTFPSWSGWHLPLPRPLRRRAVIFGPGGRGPDASQQSLALALGNT